MTDGPNVTSTVTLLGRVYVAASGREPDTEIGQLTIPVTLTN